MILMVTVCYEDGAYRVGGLPDNQTLAFDTLDDMSDAAWAMLNVAHAYVLQGYDLGENC